MYIWESRKMVQTNQFSGNTWRDRENENVWTQQGMGRV